MSEMTGWFPPHIKPVREGVYQIRFTGGRNIDYPMYATWNGEVWSTASQEKDDHYHTKFSYALQEKYWRGFTEEQK